MKLKHCNACGKAVSPNAPTCPACGQPKPAQKKAGPVANVLAAVLTLALFVGLPIWGVNSCSKAISSPPRTDEQHAAHAAQEAAKWQDDVAKQRQRKALIDKLIQQGVFRRVVLSTDQFDPAQVVVGEAFYRLSYDQKKAFVDVVYAYTATSHKSENVVVELRDGGTNKKVGGRNLFGFKVDR